MRWADAYADGLWWTLKSLAAAAIGLFCAAVLIAVVFVFWIIATG